MSMDVYAGRGVAGASVGRGAGRAVPLVGAFAPIVANCSPDGLKAVTGVVAADIADSARA